ncbi:hypothetical protein NQ317_003561 [Molorchus minor]|uniref:RNA-directed DNA polymerase n=1 Tax=Molorchus minor TaxID=1323400 RepID=A0ABQ9J2S9_9CUCU|nr:hypothetical protein NQ317_003561 [Molorchus minor]
MMIVRERGLLYTENVIQTINLLTTSLPRINIKINGRTFPALLDSGAALNVIAAKYTRDKPPVKNGRLISLACGPQAVATYGDITYDVQINKRSYTTTFTIIDELNEEIILGMPFLQVNKGLMDFDRKCMYLGQSNRHTVFWAQVHENSSDAKIPETLNIPTKHQELLTPLFTEFVELFEETTVPEFETPKRSNTLNEDNINIIGIDTLTTECIQQQKQSEGFQRDIATWRRLMDTPDRTPEEVDFLENHLVKDNALWKRIGNKLLIVVPRGMVKKVIQVHHEDADHPGADETKRQIERRFFFPENETSNSSLYTYMYPMCSRPYEESHQKNRYVIIAEDIFTKWTEAKAFVKVTAREIVNYLEQELIPRFGYPKLIISDNGTQFTGTKFQEWCRKKNISTLQVAVYHQRANPVERRVQEKSPKSWDKQLPKIMGTLRSRQNNATQQTPYFAVYGTEIPRRGEWNHPELVKEMKSRPTAGDRQERARENQTEYQKKIYRKNSTRGKV